MENNLAMMIYSQLQVEFKCLCYQYFEMLEDISKQLTTAEMGECTKIIYSNLIATIIAREIQAQENSKRELSDLFREIKTQIELDIKI